MTAIGLTRTRFLPSRHDWRRKSRTLYSSRTPGSMPDNADIERLLHAYIDSPAQLEALAAMAANATRSWSAQDVADMFGVSLSQASRDLESLCARNLLDVRITNTVRYRFVPGQSRVAEDIG